MKNNTFYICIFLTLILFYIIFFGSNKLPLIFSRERMDTDTDIIKHPPLPIKLFDSYKNPSVQQKANLGVNFAQTKKRIPIKTVTAFYSDENEIYSPISI